MQSARKKRWIGWAIQLVGATLMLLLVAFELIPRPYHSGLAILAFCLIFLGSTVQLLAAREESKAKGAG